MFNARFLLFCFRMNNQFIELWGEECGVCYEEKCLYFVNKCNCKNIVCRDCYYQISKCPFCRRSYIELPITTFTLTVNRTGIHSDWDDFGFEFYSLPGSFPSSRLNQRDRDRAKRNWNYWFNYFNGREVFRRVYTGPLFNNDIVHLNLRTGSFDDINAAGVCVDRQRARRFVENQLLRFMSEH